MINPHASRTELEEMVVSSPYGAAFIAPTYTPQETVWSFLIHEKHAVVRSVEEMIGPGDREDDHSNARCILITLNSEGSLISILAFLFRFEASPPATYSLFVNPSDDSARELLDDLSRQEELTIDLYDERHMVRYKSKNNLRAIMRDTLASLESAPTVTEGTFDLALDNLLSGQFDPESLWELSEACSIDGGSDTA
jgi:hypothetical protein